jgi:UDP-glucose 4-epimerase
VNAAFAGFQPDVICHLAALLPVQCQDNPYLGYQVNVMGTANVLQCARQLNVSRVVFTSSKAAYGEVGGQHGHPNYKLLPEGARCHPVNVYDYGKLACEGLGENFARTGGPEFAALRFATIFGPGKVGRHGPMSTVSAIVEDAVAGRPVRLKQGADQGDDCVYVADAGEAIAVVAMHEAPLNNHIYNIGGGRAVPLSEFCDIVRGCVPGADIELGPGLDPMGFGVAYYSGLDCSRVAEEFDYSPRDLRVGVQNFVTHLRGSV